MSFFDSNRQLSKAIDSRKSTALDSIRWLSAAIVKSIAIGSIRLLSIAIAFSASADIDLSGLQYSTSAASAGRRLELRDEGTVGHALVNGMEYKGDPNGGAAAAWNTASLATGWQTLTSGTNATAILKLDPSTTAIEGGRLQSDTTWSNAKTHVVRNWVTVPSGVTLTISQGAIVKFCELAGIKVLSGGKIQINGAEGADVFFASIGNDTYGGDTNMRAGDFETNSYEIVTLNGGTWSDNGYWVTPDAAVRPYPEVALHDAIGAVEGGVVRVPVSVSGTRNAPFSIDWQIAGAPFTSTSGTLTWSQSSEGTKFIEIPIKANYSPNGTESFALSATRARSVNLSNETVRVSVYSGHIAVGDVIENGESTPSAGTEIETRGIGGTMIAKALENITYSPRWSGAASCEVAVDGNRLLSNAIDSGTLAWSRPSTPGLYTFTHKAGGETLTARFAVLGDDTTAIESNRLQSNTTWTADKTWLITGELTVPSGVTLTIEPGAVVKFMPGAKLIVEAGGTSIAKGVKFTHAYDDAVGGDTLFDGAATLPAMEDYEIKGTVTDDDSTEYRYTAPIVLSGTIMANTTWRGWKVYNVTGNLTIQNGVTLTVEPGAVVKFNSGVSLTVSSGATLNAIGTRAQPIVFTSIKDDEFGGDTNGDGDKTYPWAGDWARIYAGGTLNMSYCRIRYCNNNSDNGAIQGSGGTVTFDNGIIESSVYECVRMNSGRFVSHNSVFRDASMGFGYYGGSGVYVYNGVVADCTTACRASNKHFYNTVFYNCLTFLESTSSSCDHCVFFNEPGMGAQSATQVGSNGNIWGDPLFIDPDNGDFRIQKGSPCINAGDAVNAPEFDYYGQPRDDGAPDIGIYELAGGMSVNDLAAAGGPTAVSATAGSGGPDGAGPSLAPGDALNISYEVANVGRQAVNGSWRDKVSLVSADGGYSIDLGIVVQTASLAAGATNTFNAAFVVPPEAEGTWRVQVNVNVERDIYEGTNILNNAATSSGTVEISLPARAAADGFSGTVKKGAPATAKFALDGAEPMVARINAPAGTIVYLGSGFMPSASSYSARAVVGADGGLIGIPAGVTSAYLLVETTSSKGVAFTMTLESAALAVQSVTPATIPYTGTTGLVIDGANFAEGGRVALCRDQTTVIETAATVVSPTRLTAQIDCSRLTAGATYDVKVVGPATGGSQLAATATLPNAVIVANVPAAPKLKATLDAPASVRRGRTLTVYIDYENVGNADLPAPIFELISEGQVFKIDGACYTNSVKVMGLSSEAPVGTLRPGEPQRLGIPVTILAENVKWKLKSYHAAQEGAKKRLQLEALMGERWVRDLARSDTNLYYAVCSLIGKTWAECYNRMGNSLSEKLEANAYILTFDEAVEIFVKDAYEKAKNSKESKSRGRVLSAGPNLLTGNAVTWISEEGELTGTDYKDDNSHDGDVWWLKKYSENIGGVPTVHYHWYSITNASVRTELSGKLDNVFLICHGNANSVHEPWIEKLAKDAISAGYTAVLAVDWGDGSCSHLAVNPEKNSTYIPAAGAEAIRQLQKVGVAGGNLTICGHSHGGHLGGIIAKGMGAKRLIGMDTSPIWTHENTPAKNRYPLGWSRSSANTIEFYKSSWHYSMGTDPTDEGNGPIFGIPSFYVTQEGDFYNDDYVRGGRKRGKGWLKNFKALSRHGFSYEWVTDQMSLVKTMNWKDSSKTWQQLSGSTSGLPDAGLFAGVIREGLMECGSQVRKAVADTLGVDMYAVKWNYDEYMFNNGHKPGTLMILQEKFVQISEHGLDGMYYTSDEFKTGQTYDWLLEGVQNYADNTSIDYNHSTLKDVDKPWDKGFGIAIFIADVSDFSSTLYNGITEGNTSSSGGRLKWADIEALKNAGVRFELISSKCDESAFVRPGKKANDTGVVKMNGAIPESVFTGSDGLGDEKDGRLCLVVGAVGIVGTQGDAQLKLYEGELCPDNNFFARLIRVKSDGPTSDVLSGTALHFEWSYEQVSAFAPDNIQDDNTWTADENGNWTVTLTGATSYGPTNIVAGSWTGFDCTVSQREWSPNPNVTVTGHLFTGEDGDFVPAQDYTVILAVEDANGKIGTKEYTFTIKRHVDEDDGEDEDDDSSNEPMSCDPNEMAGPEGAGEKRLVQPGDWLTYTIYFENKSDAEAAAACVDVVNPLNEWLDWSSLTMLDVGYNNNVDNGLSGKHEGESEHAMEGTNTSVRTEFAVVYYDEEGNVLDENALAARSTSEGVYARAEWYLRIIDPNGDAEAWPLDMTGGFLPPNDEETHCGEGYIRYKIHVRDDAPGNVVITNSATIIFDKFNDPIETDPAWWNTVAQAANVKLNGDVEGDVTDLDLIVGAPYGELPTPKARTGYAFGGWYTGPNGTGRCVTAQSLVSADDSALYAHWLANTYTLSFDAEGGSVSPEMKKVVYGVAVGELPTPVRDGYAFDGWQMNGAPITDTTVYHTAGDGTATAMWKAVPPPAQEPVAPELWPNEDGIADPAPASVASEYNGYLYDANTGAVAGTIQVKVGKPKAGLAAVKATVVFGAAKKSLKADGGKAAIAEDGPTVIQLVGGESCVITLGAEGLSGTYGPYQIDGARNFFSSKDKGEQGAANVILEKWIGAVNVAWREEGAARSVIAPYQTLSVTIGKKGKAKVAVTLANGTKATANAQMLVGEEWLCVPVVVTKKANLAFTLWLPRTGGEVVVTGLGDDVVAGKPGSLKADAKFRIDADAFSAAWGQRALPYLPDGMEVTQSGAKWTLPKAGKVQKAKDGTIDASKLGENPSGLKLTYKAKDGSFKGSFKAYADNAGKLKATTVNVTGVVVNGVGYGTASIKKVGSVEVGIE